MYLAKPARSASTLVATISVHDGTIAASLPDYDESFADVARALGYTWQAPHWQRTVPADALPDRVAELGHHLLLAGFAVDFPDEATRDRALAGDFAAECRRWVRAGQGPYSGWLAIHWPGRDRSLYDRARDLPGSRYDRDTYSVVAPPEQHAAVVAFAKAHGFALDPRARDLIAAARARLDTALVVDPKSLVTPQPILPDLDQVLAEAGPVEAESLPIARPSSPLTATRVRLAYAAGADGLPAVDVRFSDGDDARLRKAFRAVMKRFGCHWHDEGACWRRRVDSYAGDVHDRAAEVGQLLLAAGFVVQYPDDDTLRTSVAGTFQPEQRRWVHVGRGQYRGWFRLWWRRSEDLYTRAKMVEGARYDQQSKSVVVPPEQVEEVLGFAEVHRCELTPAALALVKTARAQRDAALVVDAGSLRQQSHDTPPAPVVQPGAVITVGTHHLDTPYYPERFGLRTALLPHQVPAAEKLLPLRVGGLFMDMGTGKTRVAIELAHCRQQRLANVVWFCPVSLKQTIREEIKKHTDTPDDKIVLFDEDTAVGTLPAGAFWHIVGTESMSSSDRVALAAHHTITPDTFVVVDESTYIKGHASRRTRRITYMSEPARYRCILTGTPLTQGVVDLYAQMRFLAPDILGYGSFYSFAANHLEYHPDYPGMIVHAHNTDYLAAKIAPYIWQITKEEAGLDLPAKLYDTRYFSLTPAQHAWYERAKNEILLSAPDWELDTYAIFRLFTALQQVASGFWNRGGNDLVEFDHDRLNILADVVASLPSEEKVIIWCKYRYSVQAIAARLRGEYGPDSVALYYGDLSETERTAELAHWRAEARFLVATQATGGHGLTLTEAAYALFYENGFKYSERRQAEDRIHRLGQTRRPTYVDLVAQCGIDRRIQDALAHKANVAQSFRREMQKAKDAGREQLENLVKTL